MLIFFFNSNPLISAVLTSPSFGEYVSLDLGQTRRFFKRYASHQQPKVQFLDISRPFCQVFNHYDRRVHHLYRQEAFPIDSAYGSLIIHREFFSF